MPKSSLFSSIKSCLLRFDTGTEFSGAKATENILLSTSESLLTSTNISHHSSLTKMMNPYISHHERS